MKNNKGFTLVELLATIVIVILLLTLVSPKIISIINNNRNKAYYEIERRLEEAAAKYIVNEYISSDQTSAIISKEELINSGYIEEIYDLKDNSTCSAHVYAYDLNGVAKFDSVVNCASYETKEKNGSAYIMNLLEQENTLHNGLIVDDTEDKNIRYAGANDAVNNYVYFNCAPSDGTNDYGSKDYKYADKCEVWRIIGVFDTKTNDDANEVSVKRIKIVRDEFLKSMSWDSSSSGESGTENNSGWGINQWADIKKNGNTIYEGSDLMRMLNGYYIRESDTCTYCNSYNQGICPSTNNCAGSIVPLSTTSLEMIDNSLWYTGASSAPDELQLLTMYTRERSTQTGKICSFGDNCTDKVTRTTRWVGKIGLIYPSDYGYASTYEGCSSDIVGSDSTCNKNNWLHPSRGTYWTITPCADFESNNVVWRVRASYRVDYGSTDYANSVRPSLYLAPNVKIIGGNGTTDSPYRLSV